MDNTIVIVDDDENILKVTKIILEKSGYKVKTFSNSPEALEHVAVHIPDLVLLDLGLPDMDGFEIFEKLSSEKSTASIPVIMFTAHGRDREIAKAKKLGLKDYIVKPFIPGNLLSTIRKVLGQ